LLVPALAFGQHTVVGSTSSTVGPLVRTELVVQVGPNPIDNFKMTRLARDVPVDQLRGSILLLPSLGSTFALYEQRDPNGALGTSIAEFFALRHYDVYGYSPRFEGVPAGTCEAGVLPCAVMGDWDLQSMLDDIRFVRDQVEIFHPGTPIVAGGLSLGGMLAVAVADDDGARYDGIFPWEGMLLSNDPVVQGLNAAYCAAAQAQLGAGIVYDGVGNNVFKTVNQLAVGQPDGLTPIPLFPPFFTNRQVLLLTTTVPAPGPVTEPVPGYVLLGGDLAQEEFFFASEERLTTNVLTTFNDYVPVPILRDIPCALAGLDTTHIDDLDSYTGAVLMIGGGRAFGGAMQDQLDAFTGASSRELLLEPDFGHVDHFMSPHHRRYVERPILRWLRGLF
jgi:pimeloyl-ACP methyl ester carboxylesterase